MVNCVCACASMHACVCLHVYACVQNLIDFYLESRLLKLVLLLLQLYKNGLLFSLVSGRPFGHWTSETGFCNSMVEIYELLVRIYTAYTILYTYIQGESMCRQMTMVRFKLQTSRSAVRCATVAPLR